jgi:2,3-bisphosphoglycerate-independent phosphoglycerate mutase
VNRRPPFVLTILDGWGCREGTYGNAIAAADTPNWNRILATYPSTRLEASGEAVGLPKGIMGNSEVGHINIGSGRTVPQGIVVIDAEIADGSFATKAVLHNVLDHVKHNSGTLHFLGLLSDGKVHSSMDHLEALITAAVSAGVPIAVDAFLDGRDVPPRSAQTYIERLEAFLAHHGRTGAITSISGRYYAMDRDKRWDRTEKAYAALVRSEAAYHATTATDALAAAYARY